MPFNAVASISCVIGYDSEDSKHRMPRSCASRNCRVNSSCPSSRCTRPLKVPVPNARRVTFTPDLPSVTQSVADRLVPCARRLPLLIAAAAPRPLFRNRRREQAISHLGPSYHAQMHDGLSGVEANLNVGRRLLRGSHPDHTGALLQCFGLVGRFPREGLLGAAEASERRCLTIRR